MSANSENGAAARALATQRANTGLRLAATLAVALIMHQYIGMRWVWAWAALYGAIVLAERVLARGSGRDHGWRRIVLRMTPFLSSTVFGALSIPLFASHIRFAPTLGGMLLAGALLNVVMANVHSRAAIVAAGLPHVLYLLIVPFVARAANPGSPLANALWLGALLLVISVVVAARTLRQAMQAEAQAKREAERRRYEAEEAVAAKSAFVAMISHELRTPISAILAGAARLHSEVPEASAKVHAQLIADAGGLMRTLLNDLLDFSRLEAGRMSVEKTAFNLRQTLADTLRLWRPEAARKGLRLRIEGAAGLPRWVSGDPTRLRQVLNNLLSNAIKFTAQGGVTISLHAREEAGSLRLTIDVVDTGPGIDQTVLPRLFTPFDQLSSAVVRQHGGSGLGLVISRELARLMGGDLTATSASGFGAHFTLTTTFEPAEAPSAAIEGPSITGLRVLVVDDHVVNRRAIELILQPFGVDATLAESGEEALELLGAEAFDAVLMDVYMPGLDGRETTRRLRAGTGPNRAIPVVAVTASATPKDWDECAEAGMDAHVSKPIDPAELFGALAQVLAREPSAGAPASDAA